MEGFKPRFNATQKKGQWPTGTLHIHSPMTLTSLPANKSLTQGRHTYGIPGAQQVCVEARHEYTNS